MNLFDRILSRTKENFIGKLTRLIAGKSQVDDEVLDELETILVSSDAGITTTVKIIERLKERVRKDKYISPAELNSLLKSEIEALFPPVKQPVLFTHGFSPYVVLVVGVNGVGKTTTIGKLAKMYKSHGNDVVLGAADTFRAAAVDQLKIWAQRAGVPVIAHKMGSDPGAVAYDTVASALAKKINVAIIDTAGRLHSKIPLMNELSKIKKVIQKVIPAAPHEVMLVLDASTGQNAFEQARQFTAATQVNSVAVTKLDGTAKGGVVIGISDQFKIPVKFVGSGEGIDDLKIFNAKEFVDSLFRN